ncbi:MAG TPA: 3-isopropylmalate dehydratase small subunit, partial [Acidobacteriaceae bacterium]|nr:3-isopropylmalate dehydratase small subunit [Acidobacteriaceae bacterium]
AIIPKQFIKSIRKTGLGPYLFDEWRYLDRGSLGQDCSKRPLNAEFVLNRKSSRNAQILLARGNFGCGSSREHAVWALQDHGFRVVIAPGFADIFSSNCYKNGLLPVTLDEKAVDDLFSAIRLRDDYQLGIDLQQQCVAIPDGSKLWFSIDEFHKNCLLNGLDDIALTLQDASAIHAYELKRRQLEPWIFGMR